MERPNNYENTQVQGAFEPVELGGHYLIIKEVAEMKSATGKNMVRVCFDFAKNDKQPGYFAEQFKNDIRPDKKWPNQAVQYILTEDSEGNCSRSFKTFITCVEHSNKMTVQWGENFGAQFKNKAIGGVFGPQMHFYNSKESKRTVLRWFVSTDKVKDAQIPELTETKEYKAHKSAGPIPSPMGDGFMNLPDGIDEELPFN